MFGRAFGQHVAALDAAFRTHVDEPVAVLDDVQVVLDDQHGVALVDQLVQHLEQLAHILEVQAGGRLVQDVERVAGGAAAQLLAQLDALRLAAGERGGRLAQLDVAQADGVERLQLVAQARDVLEELERLPRRSCRARRRWTCRGSGSPASRGCSACPCTLRRARRHRAGTASRCG